ncbi:DMSO/selenate family reductase complex A subunit [Alkalibacter saccharofermentans]|uniref:Anaerobic dimethyl sulfoxide reductase subunit A n=1 Tax=Alkalibacter saccharofermentans DSM 14828 TaxID=1120975 RepID=A0A1M4WE49_9FIRM|nr:DMSO/selenate family reductase complex A subunit [Alkalibacter saccharofermentans]SHE79455.1 anaerobic dimethyl sulfoxide reductase subunit A [Alkalibacter saccharofermentans DSM 14828]
MEKWVLTSGTNNCGGRCIIKACVKNGQVVKIETEKPCEVGDEVSLTACPRGINYSETFLSDKRLRYPMKRVGKRGEGKFERISWNDAIKIIADEWIRIREKYGMGSRYVNYSTGNMGVMRGYALVKHLLALDGGFLDYYNSYSDACTTIATPYTYGTEITGNSLTELKKSKLIILSGHNPAETRFGDFLWHLKEAKKAGVKIIAIDPRFSDTAKSIADEWIGIKPGTDSALIDAMAYVLYTKELHDKEFLNKFCIGFDEEHMPQGIKSGESYEAYITGKKDGIPKTPLWAEAITGIDAKKIELLAIEYASSKPAAFIQGWGPQRHSNGEQAARSSTLIACMTGNVGVAGGWAGGKGSIEGHEKPAFPQAKNPYSGKIPVFLWTDGIIRGTKMTAPDDGLKGVEKLDSDIKMIINLAGNILVNQHSDINRTIKILKDESLCEFILCSDLFMTPSAKFADILLPGTSMFENENITRPWMYGDFILYNNKAIDPMHESRFEYDWLCDLAKKLGLLEKFSMGGKSLTDYLEYIYEELREREKELPQFNVFVKNGGYKYKNNKTFIAFSRQIEDPDNCPFPTPSGKIEIFSKRLYDMNKPDEIPAIPKYTKGFEGIGDDKKDIYPLQLIGWHTKRRTHSTHESNEKMAKLEAQRLWISIVDAKKRGICDGDMVEVYNDRGKINIEAFVTDKIIQGVVAMPQGAWYKPDGESCDKAGSINVLTTSKPTPLAKGNPQHSNLVEVSIQSSRRG